MKAEGEWERFVCSGRVQDYLDFKAKETAGETAGNRQGERLYAGFRSSDRDGDQNDTCR